MGKKEIQKKIDTVKLQIKNNARDSHFTEKLLDELLSLKGQIDVEPLDFNVGKRTDSFDGGSYEIVKTTEGAYFKVRGGMMVFARPNMTSLYEALVAVIENKEAYEKMEGEDKDNYEMLLSSITCVLSAPMYAFSDQNFTFKLATMVVNYLRDLTKEAEEKPLQEETPVDNAAFKDANVAVGELNKIMEDEE